MKLLAVFCILSLFAASNSQANSNSDDYVQVENKHDQFDWKLIKQALKSHQSNVLISPLSAKFLLTLLAEAAGQTFNSETRMQLDQVLPESKNLNSAKEYFTAILESIQSFNDAYHVNFANRLYVDKIVSINQRFGATIEHFYNSKIVSSDFSDVAGSAQLINNWIKESTNGKIGDVVLNSDIQRSILILISALYFEGTWTVPFNTTASRDFFTAPDTKVSKTFMEETGSFHYCNSQDLNAQILRMPYEGKKFSMFIILPNAINGADAVTEKLDSNILRNDICRLEKSEVHVVIPKFKFDASISLNDDIKSIGINEIFESSATFPLFARGGGSQGKLKVSNIIQRLGIAVDEKGVTVKSTTDIEQVSKFGAESIEFIADHPFIFFIEDDTTGAKLFAGRVSNPEY
ncbi:serine protease inhibitor 2-like [Chironomus tepperi]|uniref:serine protease inhibitor 2-like n=1 Tax=Chironomus tepperi TaxID=113505 RepID=UPI00391F0B63